MPEARKVILFLVEGPTEKEALSGVLSRIFGCADLVFKVVHGDITTATSISSSNVFKEITEYIRSELILNGFEASDVERVAHLVDTDGCFIPSENIHRTNEEGILYFLEYVSTNHLTQTQKRFQKKSRILNKLTTRNYLTISIQKIPYYVYFMSRNLEHALHNRFESLSSDEKTNLARSFDAEYNNNIHAFYLFINSPEVAASGDDYAETWEFIKQGNNSLHRHTNLHCIINEYMEP